MAENPTITINGADNGAANGSADNMETSPIREGGLVNEARKVIRASRGRLFSEPMNTHHVPESPPPPYVWSGSCGCSGRGQSCGQF